MGQGIPIGLACSNSRLQGFFGDEKLAVVRQRRIITRPAHKLDEIISDMPTTIAEFSTCQISASMPETLHFDRDRLWLRLKNTMMSSDY